MREKSPSPKSSTPTRNSQYARGKRGLTALAAMSAAALVSGTFSRARNSIDDAASTPGISAIKMIDLNWIPRYTSSVAVSGPTTAPIMSAARSSP